MFIDLFELDRRVVSQRRVQPLAVIDVLDEVAKEQGAERKIERMFEIMIGAHEGDIFHGCVCIRAFGEDVVGRVHHQLNAKLQFPLFAVELRFVLERLGQDLITGSKT